MAILHAIPRLPHRDPVQLARQPAAPGLRERPLPKHHASQMTATIRTNPMSGRAP